MTMLLNSFVFGGGGGGGPSEPEAAPVIPDGVPDPIMWFSARDVTLSGSDITAFLNQGSTGATNDAFAETANYATISTPASWGGRSVIDLGDTATGGYDFGSIDTKSVIGMATYKAGTETTFSGGHGYVGKGTASATVEMVGQSGYDEWNQNYAQVYYINGVQIAAANGTVLPMLKNTIAAIEDHVTSGARYLFREDLATSGNWRGLSGDVLFFAEELTGLQIAKLHTMLRDYYNDSDDIEFDSAATYVVEGIKTNQQRIRAAATYVVEGIKTNQQRIRAAALYVIE